MDNIDVLNLKRKVRELEIQHNNLTALVKVLYNNLKQLKAGLATNTAPQQSQPLLNTGGRSTMVNRSHNDIKADEILSQLAANVR
jgi:hypothetical protein